MKMTAKSVWVSFLIIVFLESWFCEGCWKHERDALLHLKAQFQQSPSDWVDGTDCCLWEYVECDNNTRRVAKLDLSGSFAPSDGSSWYLNMSDFQVFDALESLDLSYNKITGCVQNEGAGSGKRTFSLSNLKHLDFKENYLNDSSILPCLSSMKGKRTPYSILEDLDLSSNFFSNDIISSLRSQKDLKQLDLSLNKLNGSLDISELKALAKLEILDLSENKINSFIVRQGTRISLTNLKALSLIRCEMDGSILRNSLRPFQYIKKLDLSANHFAGTILAADFGELKNLEELELDNSSNITTEFFKSIGSLTSLKVLSMSDCNINGTLPIGAWSNLKKLEILHLQNNQFEGPLPISFANMTSLKTLNIYQNHFTGNPCLPFASLVSLETLDFSFNQFDIPASFTFLANYSNLKILYGGQNKVIADDSCPGFQIWVPKFQLEMFEVSSTTEASILPLPDFLVHQYNLINVDFSDIKYGGEFPNWLMENNTNMESLKLGNCIFRGHFQLPVHPLPRMGQIDLSNNSLTGKIPGKNISSIFPEMEDLDMSRNAFHGSLPHEFGQMSALRKLDLSYNKLEGPVCATFEPLNVLRELYLNGNKFSGSVESCLNMTWLQSFDISDNQLVGNLPTGALRNLSMMSILIANNNLEGSIPKDFFKPFPDLQYIDLSENSLSGSLPAFPSSLIFAQFSNNKLSGLTTMMFNESYSLTLLDLSNNDITGHLQDMGIGNTSKLSILLLKGNRFIGKIPNDFCKLSKLAILDLSNNKLSSPIPKCVGEIPFGSYETAFYDYLHSSPDVDYYGFQERQQVKFTTKKRSETYKGNILRYMSGMDLSHNELNGSIPLELGNLTYIRAINLSQNLLTGGIPATLSHLKQIESLDLSFNMLTGEISPQLTELTFLEVFSLAHNNLSGKTPERKNQFISFNETSYEGNPFLCGPPLNKSCSPADGQTFGNASDIGEHEDDGFVDKQFFYISFVVSYASVLLVLLIVIYVNPRWRRAWFYFIELVIINCYYFVVVYFLRWFTKENM